MKTYAYKTQKNKNQYGANEVSQKHGEGKAAVQFVDNRPEAVAHRKLQELVDNSPKVLQLKAFQEMADSYFSKERGAIQIKENTVIQRIGDNQLSHDAQQYEPIVGIVSLQKEAVKLHKMVENMGAFKILYKKEVWEEMIKKTINEVLHLQILLVKRKKEYPNEYLAQVDAYDKINQLLKSNIELLTKLNMDTADVKTGVQLARAAEGEMISLAMRITVANAPAYRTPRYDRDDTNRERPYYFGSKQAEELNELQGRAKGDKPKRGVPATVKGTKAKGLKEREEGVEHNGEAVCSAFAAAAASKLSGQDAVRVEIMGSSLQHHNFVVVGRKIGSNLNDITTWGDNCRIIDPWWGAIKWQGFGEYPPVVYTVQEHIRSFGNKPNAIYYDSQGGEADVEEGVGAQDMTLPLRERMALMGAALRKPGPPQ